MKSSPRPLLKAAMSFFASASHSPRSVGIAESVLPITLCGAFAPPCAASGAADRTTTARITRLLRMDDSGEGYSQYPPISVGRKDRVGAPRGPHAPRTRDRRIHDEIE